MEQPTENNKPAVQAPKAVQAITPLLFLYGVFSFGNALAVGFRSGNWGGLLYGVTTLALCFWLAGGLLTLQSSSWWFTVVGSVLWCIRSFIGIVAWFERSRQGLAPDSQSLIFYIFTLLILGFIAVRLLKREVRAAYGIGNAA